MVTSTGKKDEARQEIQGVRAWLLLPWRVAREGLVRWCLSKDLRKWRNDGQHLYLEIHQKKLFQGEMNSLWLFPSFSIIKSKFSKFITYSYLGMAWSQFTLPNDRDRFSYMICLRKGEVYKLPKRMLIHPRALDSELPPLYLEAAPPPLLPADILSCFLNFLKSSFNYRSNCLIQSSCKRVTDTVKNSFAPPLTQAWAFFPERYFVSVVCPSQILSWIFLSTYLYADGKLRMLLYMPEIFLSFFNDTTSYPNYLKRACVRQSMLCFRNLHKGAHTYFLEYSVV